MDRKRAMNECLDIHFLEARERFKRIAYLTFAVALTPALLIAIFIGNVRSFFGLAILFGFLASPMPLAAFIFDFVRIRQLRRRFEHAPESVSSVVDSKIRINGVRSRRAMVTMNDGDRYGLIVPAERIEQLVAAFPPRDDFETLLARIPS